MNTNQVFKDLASKMERFCDYQERSTFDVKKKLILLEAPEIVIEDIIGYLKEKGFLDDLRYATSFVYGKFTNKKWGKKKIYAALKAKKIDSNYIYIALDKIDEDIYYDTLEYICEKKVLSIGGIDSNVNIKKLLNFALQRGFESNFIWKFINKNKYRNGN